MTRDRLTIETTVLDNGITIYEKPYDVPFVHVRIVVPIGHIHNTDKFLPGSAHLIEHLICARSKKYPQKGRFKEKLGLVGGSSNAMTAHTWTEFYMNIPTNLFDEFFPDFIERIRFPLITKEFVDQESGIILNESLMYKWFPAKNEIYNYQITKWMQNYLCDKRTIFGEQKDFEEMDAEKLLELHANYFTKGLYVVIGGNYNKDIVMSELSKIEMNPKLDIPIVYDKVCWKNRNYHEVEFNTDRYIYHLGGIIETDDISKLNGMRFIGKLMTNSIHGPLHQWLRRDLGLVYALSFDFNFKKEFRPSDWCYTFPLSNYSDVTKVRSILIDFIGKSLNDEKLLKTEMQRIKNLSIYGYQTLESIIEQIIWGIRTFGFPVNEAFMNQHDDIITDKKFILGVFDEFFHPDQIGELLIVPKKS